LNQLGFIEIKRGANDMAHGHTTADGVQYLRTHDQEAAGKAASTAPSSKSNVPLSHVGRVVWGTVAVAAGTASILAFVAPVVGPTYAALGIAALIGGAILGGVLTR